VCSTAASLPEVCGDGALYFDPDDLGTLVAQLDRLESDPDVAKRATGAGLGELPAVLVECICAESRRLGESLNNLLDGRDVMDLTVLWARRRANWRGQGRGFFDSHRYDSCHRRAAARVDEDVAGVLRPCRYGSLAAAPSRIAMATHSGRPNQLRVMVDAHREPDSTQRRECESSTAAKWSLRSRWGYRSSPRPSLPQG
jgi:hypothetical protein